MIDALQDFTSSLPDFLQWFGVMLVAAIPFVDSYFGAVIGVLIGLPTALAIGAAVIGNVISMLIFVMTAQGARNRAVASRRRKRALVGAGVGARSRRRRSRDRGPGQGRRGCRGRTSPSSRRAARSSAGRSTSTASPG